MENNPGKNFQIPINLKETENFKNPNFPVRLPENNHQNYIANVSYFYSIFTYVLQAGLEYSSCCSRILIL